MAGHGIFLLFPTQKAILKTTVVSGICCRNERQQAHNLEICSEPAYNKVIKLEVVLPEQGSEGKPCSSWSVSPCQTFSQRRNIKLTVWKTKLADLVQIAPEDFSKRSIDAIEDNLNAKYSNKVRDETASRASSVGLTTLSGDSKDWPLH